MVGGATRMPVVQRLIQQVTGVKPRLTVNPGKIQLNNMHLIPQPFFICMYIYV
jgi:molecular chaperone DnaK (HSP70)